MQSIEVYALFAWIIVFIPVSAWVWNDAYYEVRTRMWAIAVFISGPVALSMYLYLTRWKTGVTSTPPYELRINFNPERKKENTAALNEGAQRQATHFSLTGLPHCPRCGQAVSKYDTRCMRCGLLLKNSSI